MGLFSKKKKKKSRKCRKDCYLLLIINTVGAGLWRRYALFECSCYNKVRAPIILEMLVACEKGQKTQV